MKKAAEGMKNKMSANKSEPAMFPVTGNVWGLKHRR